MRTLLPPLWLGSLALLLGSAALFAQEPAAGRDRPTRSEMRRPAGESGPRQPVPVVPQTGDADVILARPTASSVVLSLMRYDRDGAVVVTYGLDENDPAVRALTLVLKKAQPQALSLDKLAAGKRYSYQVRDAESGKALLNGSFRTAASSRATFVFTVTADSHLDSNTDGSLYQRTLANVKVDHPDFHVDLGDTFMTGKHASRDAALQQYRAQRAYWGQVGQAAPLFLALGNHDGEERRFRREGAGSLAVWSNGLRKRYFPNPVPDDFYRGNDRPDPLAGLLQDYYAWQWGDALFVVLDPYWHGDGAREEAPWQLTLGSAQYRWLEHTLASSRARFKFVFIHQLVGGLGRQGRGGAEAVHFGEWGGRNADGTEGFRQHRPGWEMPIHALLVRHGVSVVFHGHDHLYARQEVDGLVYQAVPQPGHPGERVPNFAAEYGYRAGVILGGAGHLRITVAPEQAAVDFVRGSLAEVRNRQVAHRYIISSQR